MARWYKVTIQTMESNNATDTDPEPWEPLAVFQINEKTVGELIDVQVSKFMAQKMESQGFFDKLKDHAGEN